MFDAAQAKNSFFLRPDHLLDPGASSLLLFVVFSDATDKFRGVSSDLLQNAIMR